MRLAGYIFIAPIIIRWLAIMLPYSVYSNGIEVESASYNVVQNNTCNYDLLNGIELDSNYGPASYNNLTNNYCCYNQQQDGIWLHVDNAAINNNTIVNNTCTNNGVYPLGGQGGYGIGLMLRILIRSLGICAIIMNMEEY